MHSPPIPVFTWILIGAFSPLLSALPTPSDPPAPVQIPHCPVYSRVIRRPDGEPRKCLPHQLNLCLNALDDQSLIDATGVCCYHNQVDYFCCMDIPARLCPSYRNVTVVIHNNFPQSPFPVRSFHFRKDVAEDVEGFSTSIIKKN